MREGHGLWGPWWGRPCGSDPRVQRDHLCKLALFRGETTRHLINCSTEVAYRKNVLRLRNDLKARGYPMSLLPDAPYDEPARQKHIDELFRRSREPKVKNGSMDTDRLVFKAEYSQQLRLVNIRKDVGNGLLGETWLIIAHPDSSNSFVEHYGINFPVPPNAMPTRRLWPGGVEG